jgi:O-glycosyl hydrolase
VPASRSRYIDFEWVVAPDPLSGGTIMKRNSQSVGRLGGQVLPGVIAVCLAVMGPSNGSAATITVNTSVRTVTVLGVNSVTQTIDGFGVFGSMHPWWDGNIAYYNDAFLSLYIDSLGLTLLRTELYPQPDQTTLYTQQIPYLRAIMAKANASHEPLKVFASIWSPPGNMKTSGSATGGRLLADSINAYGVYVANYVKRFNTDMGYNLYAVSPQNEPALCTAYNSACYSPDSFAPVVISVAHQIKNQNIPVWIHYSDNIPWGYSDRRDKWSTACARTPLPIASDTSCRCTIRRAPRLTRAAAPGTTTATRSTGSSGRPRE